MVRKKLEKKYTRLASERGGLASNLERFGLETVGDRQHLFLQLSCGVVEHTYVVFERSSNTLVLNNYLAVECK